MYTYFYMVRDGGITAMCVHSTMAYFVLYTYVPLRGTSKEAEEVLLSSLRYICSVA